MCGRIFCYLTSGDRLYRGSGIPIPSREEGPEKESLIPSHKSEGSKQVVIAVQPKGTGQRLIVLNEAGVNMFGDGYGYGE